MKTLYIDIETYSDIDLLTSGMYAYARSRNFELLLFAYAYDNEEVSVIDVVNGEVIPDNIIDDLLDDNVVKVAHNAIFERVCLSRYFARRMRAEQWRCTLAQCARMGVPISLSDAAYTLACEDRKAEAGKRLINIFCCPQKPTKANGMRARITSDDAPIMWQQFKNYCAQDVRTERAIDKATVVGRACGELELRVYALDARINDRGIMVDRAFVEAAVRIDGDVRERLLDEAKRITGLDNPMSTQQLTQWLASRGIKTYSLTAERVEEIKSRTRDIDVLRVMSIRQQLARTSTSKYNAMLATMCDDDRLRGMYQYYGTRTGRWSGRLVQMQNLPRTDGIDVEEARKAVMTGDVDVVELGYSNVSEVLSRLVRTAFVAPSGKMLVVCDYSAIEARVLAWLADERWRLDVFRGDGKIYEATAAALYGVDVNEITHDDPRRAHGKIAELALGYQGGVNAMIAMGASSIGLTQDRMITTVKEWRKANPNIVALWLTLEEALVYCARTRSTVQLPKGMTAEVIGNTMYICLPSGRYLCYPNIRLNDNHIHYIDDTRKCNTVQLYGGKIAENIVQAIARDCLAEAMLMLDAEGYSIVGHIHDEVIIEVSENATNTAIEDITQAFNTTPAWASGLPLRGECFTNKYYRK